MNDSVRATRFRPTRAVIAAWLVGCALACAMAGMSRRASAKAFYESPYGYQRTWNAALRLVRVDNGWKVTEKDEASGYLLFEYRSAENTKPAAGSLELVRGRDPEGPVGVEIDLAGMPRYHEQMVVNALASKMRREYGDAPPRPRAPPLPTDGGSDDGN